MTEEDLIFLNTVRAKAKDPAMLQNIILYAVAGVVSNADEIRKHAVDMETVANMAMNTKLFKGNEKFLADKLESWKHMNGLRWDDQIKRLRGEK